MLTYFAYGSNMLKERLLRRCPSVKRAGPGELKGFSLAFTKRGRDLSGKATIMRDRGQSVHGVVFSLTEDELALLDGFEGLGRGYDRLENELIIMPNGETTPAFTYMAPSSACDTTLFPFDWYHALVLAGAMQNDLPETYRAHLQKVATRRDPDADRATRLEALDVLKEAGFELLSSGGIRP